MEPVTEIVARELQSLPAELLVELPAMHVFVTFHHPLDTRIVFATQELAEPRDGWGPLTFDGPELTALITGVRCERLDDRAFRDLCAQKLANSQLRITLDNTVGNAQPRATEHLAALDFFRLIGAVPECHVMPEATAASTMALPLAA